jgi:hypothetical protein
MLPSFCLLEHNHTLSIFFISCVTTLMSVFNVVYVCTIPGNNDHILQTCKPR